MFNSELAKTRIKELGITQAHLAKKVNINESHLSQVINGKTNPSLSLVSRLAKELVVPSNQLWHLDDELFEPYQKDVDEEAIDPAFGSDYGDKKPDAYKVLSDGIVTPIYKVEDRPTVTLQGDTLTIDGGLRLSQKEMTALLTVLTTEVLLDNVAYLDNEERMEYIYTLANLYHRIKEATK